MGRMNVSNTPQYAALMRLEEPFSYRDRFTIPKMIMNSAGDQYFLPDLSQYYFDELPGEKYLRYVPNTNHSLKDSDAHENAVAFYDAFLRGQPRPKFFWKFENNGDIRVTSVDKPTEVKLWVANNPEKRDFRLLTIGPAYKSVVVTFNGDNVYIGHVERPEKGWSAYFVEMTFPSGGKYPFKLDRKSTRLNSSHLGISYAVFCLKKKKKYINSAFAVCSRRIPTSCKHWFVHR